MGNSETDTGANCTAATQLTKAMIRRRKMSGFVEDVSTSFWFIKSGLVCWAMDMGTGSVFVIELACKSTFHQNNELALRRRCWDLRKRPSANIQPGAHLWVKKTYPKECFLSDPSLIIDYRCQLKTYRCCCFCWCWHWREVFLRQKMGILLVFRPA